MTPYKGIIRIECGRGNIRCPQGLANDVEPGCLDCKHSRAVVVDLNGAVLFDLNGKIKLPDSRAAAGKAEGTKAQSRKGKKKTEPEA